MPIFDYLCRTCGHEFEEWVRKDEKPACPECRSEELDRALPTPRVHSSSTRALAMKAAKRRDKAQATERIHTQREYELNHDD